MKFHAPLIAVSLIASLAAAEVPKVFSGLFERDIPVKGQIGMVLPPPEIDKYVAKVETAARKDPKWFREFSSQAKPGVPLPYDERLGLTKEEYAEYLALWNKREFKPMEEVMLLLRQSPGGTWSITSTGAASTISTLRYVEKDDLFRSPNGDLKRIDDIKADSTSILGEWTGQEWKFEEETGLGKTKENIADRPLRRQQIRHHRLSRPGTLHRRHPPARQEPRHSFPPRQGRPDQGNQTRSHQGHAKEAAAGKAPKLQPRSNPWTAKPPRAKIAGVSAAGFGSSSSQFQPPP